MLKDFFKGVEDKAGDTIRDLIIKHYKAYSGTCRNGDHYKGFRQRMDITRFGY